MAQSLSYKIHLLKNGLKVITAPVPGRNYVHVSMKVGVGSRSETYQEKGLAHFVEHMVFRGSENYPKSNSIRSAVEGFGGELNAETDKEVTTYHINCPKGHERETLGIMGDMLFKPLFKSRETVTEKKAILEEIRLMEAASTSELELEKMLWRNHPLSWDSAGVPRTVKALTRTDCVRFHKDYYHPKNMVLTIAGDITHEKALRLAKSEMGIFNMDGYFPQYVIAPIPKVGHKIHLREEDAKQMDVTIGARTNSTHYNEAALELLALVYSNETSSRLFRILREKHGLLYDIESCFIKFEDAGVFFTSFSCNPKNALLAISLSLKEMKNLSRRVISAQELAKAKLVVRNALYMQIETLPEWASYLSYQALMEDKIKTPQQKFREINAVTAQDIKQLAQDICNSGLRIAVSGHFSNPNKFFKEMRKFDVLKDENMATLEFKKKGS